MTASLQHHWARAIIAQLHAAGCRRAVLCPGNRNVPLIAAMLEHDNWQLRSHLDERSAAFRALGWARAVAAPVAVVTTSGSALANTLPAVCEAEACGAALVVVSGDRPEEEHGCGAPQTMTQAGILRPFCRQDLALPDAPERQLWPDFLQRLQHCIQLAWAAHGPAHINIPLDNPQPWTPGKADHQLATPAQQPPPSPPAMPTAIRSAVAQARHGVVVVGADNPVPNATLARWAAAGWPIISDCLGCSRSADVTNLIYQADLLLAASPHEWQVDTIIRCGSAPLARPVWEWLQRQQDATVLRFDQRPITRDFCHTCFHYAGDATAAAALDLPTLPAPWSQRWLQQQQRCQHVLEQHLHSWHELSAAALACRAHRPQHLFVANSLSVRHANMLCTPNAPWQQVWGQRGVNGIDGNLGHALGLCESLGPLRVLIGDCALIHDCPALAAIAQAAAPIQIVVLDNGGGRIFDQLPAAQDPRLIPWIRTPQPGDITALAAAFAIPASSVDSAAALEQALAQPLNGPQLIHVRVPSGPQDQLRLLRQEISAALHY